MRRLVLCLLTVAVMLVTSAPAARAQAPANGGLRTFTSPLGYQFLVPSDWRQLSSAALPRSIDVTFTSPDRTASLIGAAVPTAGSVTAADLPDLARDLVTGVNQGASLSSQSDLNVFQGPEPAQVTNAEAAVGLTGVLSDADGNPIVVAARLALRGQTVYLLVITATQDYYSSDPNFGAILDSFQLTTPSPSPPAPPATSAGPASARFTRTPSIGLSPEEAVIAIHPYKLAANEAPAGYTAAGVYAVDTDATIGAALSSASAFSAYQDAGLVVEYSQWLDSTADSAHAAAFTVDLFTDAAAARQYASGASISPASDAQTRYDPIDLTAAVGEAHTAWHVTLTGTDGTQRAFYRIRWQRGQVVFVLSTAPRPLGQEQRADAESLVSAIDAIEQTRPPLNLGPATVTPPATEQQRFQAAMQLKPFFAGSDAAPDGYILTRSFFTTPAWDVLGDPDPASLLHRIDEQWKEVVEARQAFVNRQDSRLILGAHAALCADPEAAGIDMADDIPPPDWTSSSVDPPVQLGDATMAFRDQGPGSDGSPEEDIIIVWTHGALLLSAQMYGPAGTTSMDQLAAFAQQVEARSQANPLPTNGVAGL